jgi:hypothetical protein
MKRYAAFAFDHFYPHGGFEDFIGTFDKIKDARAAVEERNYEVRYDQKWEFCTHLGHVADLTTGKIVASFREESGWTKAY